MIDERKLIEVIKNVQDHMREANANPVPVDAREIFTLFIEMVEKQPKVDKCEIDCKNCWKFELLKPRWIPCSERLPNCNGCYLVWRPHFFGGESGHPAICYFDGQDTWHDSYGVDFTRILNKEDVAAWQPLPEPYKENADD